MLEICAELEGYGGMCSTFGGTIDGAVGGAVRDAVGGAVCDAVGGAVLKLLVVLF